MKLAKRSAPLSRKLAVAALFTSALLVAGSASAALVGVTDIKITSTNQTFIQIAEVVATQDGTGTNVALTGTATSNGSYSGNPAVDGAARAIDNNFNQNYYANSTFHSTGQTLGEFLNISLAGAFDLSSLTLFGRSDCCSNRNVFDVSFFGANNRLLFSQTGVNASNAPFAATIDLANATAVPEPAPLALLGLGFLGFALSRRKSAK